MDALSMPGLLPASLNNSGGGFSWTWLIIIALVVVRMVISSRRARKKAAAGSAPAKRWEQLQKRLLRDPASGQRTCAQG